VGRHGGAPDFRERSCGGGHALLPEAAEVR
jgi:hypothetical protein